MWSSLVQPGYLGTLFSHGLTDWFHFNLQEEIGLLSGADWKLTFGVGVWMLWSWRNNSVFNGNFSKPAAPEFLVCHLRRLFVTANNITAHERPPLSAPKCWLPPPSDWVKINVDGAVSQTANLAGCGGVARDSHGLWLFGFFAAIGNCTPLDSEEWAMLKGLQLAWNRGFRNVICESDSKLLVDLLNGGLSNGSQSIVVLQIQQLMRYDWSLQLIHICREQNLVADCLAKDGLSNSSIYDLCPTHLKTLVLKDCMGIIPPTFTS
ncbi:hypothetical protein QN277_028172 [Acacia crassicarpa]|uniref:RNase H type-1 domain-containing protein n=1 Tax=Acacia crassicarpa TaxID=499986 RepID=A0AAE1J6P6_9FABA|nr:hypothetical protein QN277_028172 [Acacia crassicarpa]